MFLDFLCFASISVEKDWQQECNTTHIFFFSFPITHSFEKPNFNLFISTAMRFSHQMLEECALGQKSSQEITLWTLEGF